MKRASALAVLLLGLLAAPRAPAAPPMRVAFVNAISPGGAWSENLVAAMRAAADDLGIHFEEYPAGHWPGETVERVRALLSGPGRPDYLIVTVHRSIGARVLEVAQQARVPVFVINAGLLEEERVRHGGPREHFGSWLGQMLPDDEQAGYVLAHALVDAARRAGRVAPDGRVHLLALGGSPVERAALERERGLRRAVAERDDVVLLQVVAGDWQHGEGARLTPLLLRRYPEATALWAANDSMALGALQALRALGLTPGRDVLVGGMNWEPPALRAVRDGELVTTLDGHFLEGAWAMVLLYDYHHGIDFAQERVDWRTTLCPITRENLPRYRPFFAEGGRWRDTDFRAFSKKENPGLKHYRFSVGAVLAQRAGAAPATLTLKDCPP